MTVVAWESGDWLVVRDHLKAKLAERGVPAHLHEGLLAYVMERREPGRFLRSVLENDLREAVARMNPATFEGLHALVLFLFNHTPSACSGDPSKVRAWLDDPSVPMVPCD